MGNDDHEQLFLKWLDEYGSAVVRIAKAYTLDSTESQDLAQEILLQAWRSMARHKGHSSLSTWFYRVALQTAMNWRRNDQPRRTKQKNWLEVNEPTVSLVEPATQIEQQDIIQKLYRGIYQLQPSEAAIVLLYLEELSYQEMADVLGITVSNVGVKLNRAKKSLAKTLKGACHGI